MSDEHENDTKPPASITVNTGGGAYIAGDVSTGGGAFTGRDALIDASAGPPPDPDSPAYWAARERYLAALRRRYDVVETHGFMEALQDEQVGRPRRLPLLGEQGMYVPPKFDAPAVRQDIRVRQDAGQPEIRTETFWESNPETLPEVLVLLPSHLVIVGDAGSGKTTMLHFIASALASGDPEAHFAARFHVLDGPAPLPVLLPLRLFERACGGQANGDRGYTRCAQDLLRFLDDWFARWCPEADLPPGFLAAHVLDGRAWLLLDGLDEVPHAGHRQTVRNVIQELAGLGTRLIVTARVAAYRGARLDDRFVVVHLRPLDDEQRTQMVRAIYAGLALPDALRRAEDLAGRFARSAALRDLTRTPVMVWTAAVIHALRGELPDSRAALYDAYVDVLLRQSFKRSRYDVTAVDVLVSGEGFPLSDRREYLTYAAFEVHRLLEHGGERHTAVGEDELADGILAGYFERELLLPRRGARQRAREFVTLMAERSGLLYESGEGYTIGDHATMREFLAGCYLGEYYRDDDAYEAFLGQAVGRTWWDEVLLLAAGHLADRRSSVGRRFLEEVAGQGETPAQQVEALALAGRGLLQLRAHRRRPNWYGGLARSLAERLYGLLYTQACEAPVQIRQEAGLVLGLLYGMPGEGTGLQDPRFSGPLGLPAFVPIEAGAFWMGEDRSAQGHEHPRHHVTLDAYQLARYPTTNAMYARFIAAGGYADPEWWAEAVHDGYWRDGKVQDWVDNKWHGLPRNWRDERWSNPAQPVVGINWYEAAAYCRWLTATLDDGYTYRLPTEAEWERAARGTSGARFPWGDEWQDTRCNSAESRLGVTSPVGLFPEGAALAASDGGPVHDLAGNAWEWCQDWYGAAYYSGSLDAQNPRGPGSGDFRVLRGGSWANDKDACRCGYRYGAAPWLWNGSWGFRCARTPANEFAG